MPAVSRQQYRSCLLAEQRYEQIFERVRTAHGAGEASDSDLYKARKKLGEIRVARAMLDRELDLFGFADGAEIDPGAGS
jgi:hypothetical protein